MNRAQDEAAAVIMPGASRKDGIRRRAARVMTGAAPVVPLLLAAAFAGGCSPLENTTLQGYIEGEHARVATAFAGTLEQLDVQRGAQVRRGDALFALENESETAARREAEQRLRTAEAQLANLRKGRRPSEIEAARAQLAQAQAALALSEAQLRRTEELVARNFVSRAQLDEARSAQERDRARVAQLQAELATTRLGGRVDEVRAAEAAAAAARAAVEQTDWRLRQKAVAAPVTGQVIDTLFVRGEWVPAGAPVVVILPPENVKVRFFVPETRLGALQVGEAVTIRCDGCPAPVPARISFIAPNAEYTPPVIYSQEHRSKLVFLVEARPAPAAAAALHPGQPVDVQVGR